METEKQETKALEVIPSFSTAASAYVQTIESMEVVDAESQAELADILGAVKRQRAALEDKRKELVGPLDSVVRKINALFKPPRDALDAIMRTGKTKLDEFAEAQRIMAEAERRRQQEEARKAEEVARQKAEELRALESPEATKVAETLERQAEKQVAKAEKPAKVAVGRGETASVRTRVEWKAEVVDTRSLCRAIADGKLGPHYIDPNYRALDELARNTAKAENLEDEKTEHGVRFFPKTSTALF